jgi:hypothetical protein
MEGQPNACADRAARPGFGSGRGWALAWLGLVAWQGWMTLTLFSASASPEALLDDQPITAGRHPLHLYHGWLGAQALAQRGTPCCYDPAFQAGYPKTPVFDGGSRPAELFLTLAGGAYRPAAYRLGLAACCALVPVWLWVAARGAGLARGPACVAVAAGLLVWWGTPCRGALEAGDLDLLQAALCAVAHVGLLIGFDRTPGVRLWLGLVVTAAAGWFAHPFLLILLSPLYLIYYISAGARHRLGWHAALLGVQATALALNSFWLPEWVTSWWIRLPLQFETDSLAHRTFHTFWTSPLWGDPADRALAVAVFALAALGVGCLNQSNRRTAARLLGLGAGSLVILAVVGIGWKPLGRLGTAHFLVPSLWFAVLPAVFALVRLAHLAAYWTGGAWRGAGLVTALVLGSAGLCPSVGLLADRCARTYPMETGLGPEREALVRTVCGATGPDARVLWEERSGSRDASHWTALLPVLTGGRAFVGGLGPDLCIEHAYADLVDGKLAGRPLDEWNDADLEEFCRHYNIGWAVCWSPAAVARFRTWKQAEPTASVSDQGPGWLFTLRPRSFVLKGQARWLEADCRRIALADVVPEDGRVVLSLHYQAGMRASPSRVQIEREPDARDPIPLIRLRVPGPVARVTLTWDER